MDTRPHLQPLLLAAENRSALLTDLTAHGQCTNSATWTEHVSHFHVPRRRFTRPRGVSAWCSRGETCTADTRGDEDGVMRCGGESGEPWLMNSREACGTSPAKPPRLPSKKPYSSPPFPVFTTLAAFRRHFFTAPLACGHKSPLASLTRCSHRRRGGNSISVGVMLGHASPSAPRSCRDEVAFLVERLQRPDRAEEMVRMWLLSPRPETHSPEAGTADLAARTPAAQAVIRQPRTSKKRRGSISRTPDPSRE